MADDINTPLPVGSGRHERPERGGRPGANREPGGFRIRLSDNEMQAARALQEAFGLRSTVAVLGFALRTMAQQLEQGQLEALVAEHRAQAGSRPPAPRGGGERRREGGQGQERQEPRSGRSAVRIDPFARPSKPPAAIEATPDEPSEATPGSESDPAPMAIQASEDSAMEPAAAPAEAEASAAAEADETLAGGPQV
jgi:hypothetical protein